MQDYNTIIGSIQMRLNGCQTLSLIHILDELRNQLKTMNRQFGFYMKHKTAMKNNLIGILDQTYPGVNTYFCLLYTSRDDICIRPLITSESFSHTVYMGYMRGKYQLSLIHI